MTDKKPAPFSTEHLALIEERTSRDFEFEADEELILLVRVDVPDLIAEVKRLKGELAKCTEPQLQWQYQDDEGDWSDWMDEQGLLVELDDTASAWKVRIKP